MQPYGEITSRDNERVKQAVKLAKSAAARREAGLFYAEGARLCLDLAATLRPAEAFFTEKALAAHPELAGIADEAFLVKPHVAEKLGETRTTQGVVCLFPLPAGDFEDLDATKGVLVLEDVQDPANVGAMLRSVAAFGFGGAVLCGATADAFGSKAVRASVGACARLPVVAVPAFLEAADALKANGVTLWAAALQGAKPLNKAVAKPPFALCIGNEGKGLSAIALDACGERVYIPMRGGVESLNAAVAASVLLYHFANGAM